MLYSIEIDVNSRNYSIEIDVNSRKNGRNDVNSIENERLEKSKKD